MRAWPAGWQLAAWRRAKFPGREEGGGGGGGGRGGGGGGKFRGGGGVGGGGGGGRGGGGGGGARRRTRLCRNRPQCPAPGPEGAHRGGAGPRVRVGDGRLPRG